MLEMLEMLELVDKGEARGSSSLVAREWPPAPLLLPLLLGVCTLRSCSGEIAGEVTRLPGVASDFESRGGLNENIVSATTRK